MGSSRKGVGGKVNPPPDRFWTPTEGSTDLPYWTYYEEHIGKHVHFEAPRTKSSKNLCAFQGITQNILQNISIFKLRGPQVAKTHVFLSKYYLSTGLQWPILGETSKNTRVSSQYCLSKELQWPILSQTCKNARVFEQRLLEHRAPMAHVGPN